VSADQVTTSPALSVVLPAYQEAENLRWFLPRLEDTLGVLVDSWEVLVVDTMEPLDDTEAVCAEFAVRHVRRRGSNDYADAIRSGIADSLGEHVVIMDCDGSHDPEFIADLWERRNDADVVIASRYVAGGATENPWILVAFSRVLNVVFSAVVGIPARDISNSFRLYRGPQLRSLELVSLHLDVQEEILARLLWELHPPAAILELPFRFKERHLGKSKRSMFVFIVAFLGAMVRLRRLHRSIRSHASR
jgi:dolichol-phosphate mannosyltransferase